MSADTMTALVAELRTQDAPWALTRFDEHETVAEFSAARIDSIRSARASRLFLRLVRDGRAGFVTATTGSAHPGEMVATARLLAAHGPADELIAPARAAPASASSPLPEPPQPPEPPADIGLAGLSAELTRAQHDLRLVIHGTARVHDLRVLMTGRDHPAQDFRQRVCHASLVVEGWEDPSLEFQWTHWGRTLELGPEAGAWFRVVTGWQDLPVTSWSGDGGLLLAPHAVHALLTPLIGALDGRAVASGRSFLRDRLGEPVLHSELSLTDELAMPAWPARPPVDDEGVPPRPMCLVEHGATAAVFHTRRTAAAAKVTPTGHGFRGTMLSRKPRQPVAPSVSTVCLSPGNAGLAELIAEVRDGVLVESLIGANQHSALSPYLEGRIRLGFVIKGGRVVARVRGQPVRWDLRDLLGGRFVAASVDTWPTGRTWTGRLPFVYSRLS